MEFLKELRDYKKINEDIKAGRLIQLTGCVPSEREHLLKGLSEEFAFTLIVTDDEQKASEIAGLYQAFDKACCHYPALDPMFFKADIQGSYLSEQRVNTVKRIYNNEKTAIVTSLDALFEEAEAPDDIEKDMIRIKKGDIIKEDEIADKLVSMGYEHESTVSVRGEFSVRGNIIDVFPYAAAAPFRIDLFGDEVDTVKIFDPSSQRSVEEAEAAEIFPVNDRKKPKDEEDVYSRSSSYADGLPAFGLLDYFKDKKTLCVIDEPVRMISRITAADPMQEGSASDQKKENVKAALRKIAENPCILMTSFGQSIDFLEPHKVYNINARNIPSYNGRFFELLKDLKNYRKEGYRVTLMAASDARAENLIKSLVENGISIGPVKADEAKNIKASDIQVKTGSVKAGFEYPDIRFSLISEVDIFGARKARRKKKKYKGDPIKDFTDLNCGDYVVHEQHGIGVYEGIERIKVDGIEKDYMKISYAKGAVLYVLATQFDRIQKYSAAEGVKPKINRLGGKEWINTKEKVKAQVKDIAQELVKLYAQRQVQKGFAFGPDTVWQREFEEDFEFEETEDQLNAIEAVKADMESDRIMDRLICGDVGFGKTEIAIRAAFKAVQDGKQVAFLTPTTILAHQHYNTITKRMSNYPVTVREMSRFATGRSQKETLKELEGGRADIVVGTHRLLSKDVVFKDLGLLIVDEEQRFGVTHKEKIKQLRKNVDVLTLSATPIPRTLHMSLTGIRDMSILTEPPVDRLPIQTYVMEYSEAAVREAIIREKERGGQVYYVYNRTNNIDFIADKIQAMLPQVNVAYAHGQMSSRELEGIMQEFVDGEIDVLVSTTIIETGLDISNVNTIIIHDADNFGLSQLYQLRGRVGRSNRTAYAFLMYKKDKLLKEVAEKRLKAIREFSDLGSGIKIAMRDLEIRGAGNVLGAEQSGHMEAVGYELYCKMLNQAVALLKGEEIEEDFETTVDLKVDGFIPASYITDEYEKLNMYKKISAITDRIDMDDVRCELKDRFGEIPKATENLLSVAYIKAKAHGVYVTEISNAKTGLGGNVAGGIKEGEYLSGAIKNGRSFKIKLFKNAPVDTYKLLEFLRDRDKELRFVAEQEPYFVFSPGKIPVDLKEISDTLTGFFEAFSKVLERRVDR